MARTFFVGGNFKLNGTKESIKTIVERLNEAKLASNTEVVLCPPAIYLDYANTINKRSPLVKIGAQNTYTKASGAYTGENSVAALKDIGIEWTILGHSERRTVVAREDDELIAEKTKFAIDSGINVILCIGELLEERKAGITLDVCKKQLLPTIAKLTKEDWSHVVIAYEPVWAIGTGLAATPEDAQETHKQIRDFLKEKLGAELSEQIRILYGGSANGANAVTFKDKADIDGFLVGGASLKPEFVDIINSRQ
ncbi:triose phosphate isomerase [Hanseniaspora valbyensis NRRL Y-1626]|uniref:Triosephosphate isomerase n=1 Tax=Hanseniaspora valbyensis NRRL Y-1626 TaxID=766949 RepID=A0A1B7TFM2_9ASCO|nr:triose phosphate isomerase [Hanseniaspora valbyensis NRRL Y-1626]